MLEQVKRGTLETLERTYQKELEKVTSHFFFKVYFASELSLFNQTAVTFVRTNIPQLFCNLLKIFIRQAAL